ncbi:hypothetical protein [Polaromonas sp. SM01]|uniref:hypothetical protein n=1 Tax=Polaromonas sp. SM01 TaxID=3085630 RepID=UPI0029816648|nr:hypothetical protein [Polaromonas sp. SM01]MDW5442101.1 hypothetical protein [Polaromonas sp. SM01]
MPNFISRVLRFALRLMLWLFAAIFAFSLLCAGLIILVFSLLKSLITGQKPKPMAFGRFQQFSAQTMWPGAGAREAAATRQADVVDVEVREIRDDKRLP